MKNLKLILSVTALLAVLLWPACSFADVNSFTVTSFDADETLSRADPQGELHIVERIKVNFSDYNHGILRAIPDSYNGHSLQLHVNKITSDTGAPSQFSTYGSNGNTVLKIGDPNRTITGAQEYSIDYTLRNVISFYNDHDELYWDVNGDQWSQTFENVTAHLHLPNGSKPYKQPICYTGEYGSKESNCDIITSGQTVTVTTNKLLTGGQTLTFIKGFEKGYFRPSKFIETLGEYSKQWYGLLIPVLLLGGGGILLWLRYGRDPKDTGIIVPQYEAPDNLSPMEIGTLIDFKTDNRDITATIISLAVKRYIKIIETKKDHLLGKDSLSYQLQLINSDYSQLNQDEAAIIAALFGKPEPNEIVDLTISKNKLYTTASGLRNSIKSRMISDGYFRKHLISLSLSKNSVTTILIIIFFIPSIATGAIALMGVGAVSGIIIGGIILAICLSAMDARTVKGVAVKERILGLKMYLNTAEKDRLENLQGPNAQYAANAGEPVKTVELFEKLLPFAIVLGDEKAWAKQFENLYTSPPDWYSGNWHTFNSYYLASNINDGISRAVNTAFSAPTSSSSSGFGGGGFSGGGGGGGGGGGW